MTTWKDLDKLVRRTPPPKGSFTISDYMKRYKLSYSGAAHQLENLERLGKVESTLASSAENRTLRYYRLKEEARATTRKARASMATEA
jgi:predicted ArsR family transcriptional regulator